MFQKYAQSRHPHPLETAIRINPVPRFSLLVKPVGWDGFTFEAVKEQTL
jgi:hypothetical protein